MPPPSYPLLADLTPLRLYRHLLREISYLPPTVRQTINSNIRSGFHRNTDINRHTKNRISRGHTVLRGLRAANSGDKRSMERVLSHGFGRTGVRRRELLSQFVKTQGPCDTETLESLLREETAPVYGKPAEPDDAQDAEAPAKSRGAFFDKWDQKKLLGFVSSQNSHQKNTKTSGAWRSSSSKGTKPDVDVPKTNIWGTEPSELLKQTRQAKWWKRNAEKLMPPLGKGEWDLLARLSAAGPEESEWTAPERRPMAASSAPDADQGSWDWSMHARHATNRAERSRLPGTQRRTGHRETGPYAAKDRQRTASSRWFRRTYNRLWQTVPIAEQNPNTLKLSFTWGHGITGTATPTAEQMEIFKGVDSKGSKI